MAEIKEGYQTIETVKKGDYFKKKKDAEKVWVRGEYNRFAKAYVNADYSDCLQNHCSLKKGALVYTDLDETDF